MSLDNYLQTKLNKELLRYGAGRRISCGCGIVLDAPTTVVLTHGDRTMTMCAWCWDRPPPWSGQHGALDVLDGRTVFKPTIRKQWSLKP